MNMQNKYKIRYINLFLITKCLHTSRKRQYDLKLGRTYSIVTQTANKNTNT